MVFGWVCGERWSSGVMAGDGEGGCGGQQPPPWWRWWVYMVVLKR